MSKVTSKLQLTIPRTLARQLRIEPGDEVQWHVSGDSLRLVPGRSIAKPVDPARRLRLFDAATARQAQRQSANKAPARTTERGWTREELYSRGRAR
ncbi:MAG: AbrB/MazE/SpoVT family DNA-binding domain-containing protein [Myxococcaceae bacterium]|nr:AbrB/MazE/SpoVT family DNA-binding domain-containing protein [Myxococcaceae bacterium]